jgi:hypothetical protein
LRCCRDLKMVGGWSGDQVRTRSKTWRDLPLRLDHAPRSSADRSVERPPHESCSRSNCANSLTPDKVADSGRSQRGRSSAPERGSRTHPTGAGR